MKTKTCFEWLWILGVVCGIVIQTSSLSAADSADDQPVAPFQLKDFRGKKWSLEDFENSKVVVIAFLGVECPLVKLYSTRLAELERKYHGQGVAWIGINSNRQDSVTEMAHFARTHAIDFPLLKDVGNLVADRLEATRTPEILVLDQRRIVRYRGCIDDQYTYGIQRPKSSHEYLADAVDALLADRPVPTPQTEVIGCLIGRVRTANTDSPVTYANQISRLLQRRCVECHREGEIAPFSLTDYDEVAGWAEMIQEVVDQQRMPPWHADPRHGEFSNEARLTDEEKELIRRWVDAGAPLGDSEQLPTPRTFTEGWQIGKPDFVIEMSRQPFEVPATGAVPYQYFVVDPGFKEDKWIQAAECRPGNRAVVHHIIVGVADERSRRRRSHATPESEWICATAPGARPMILPPGHAKRVPAGSKLIFQMHYTPNGTPQKDISRVGFVFADPQSVKRQVFTQNAVNTRFEIPPGAAAHRVVASYRFRRDARVLSLFPHMHLRGKSFEYIAIYPDQSREVLLSVPAYDFNWQNGYVFKQPKRMPAGTRLRCVAHFDNSENNLANPDPTATVRWGDQTWEEMMIGYFDMVLSEPNGEPGNETSGQEDSGGASPAQN